MYLKIEKGTKSKSYKLTDSTEKPYIMVQTSKSDSSGITTKKSYLPLTTNSSSGLYMKVEKGTETYRPLEYVSTSESDTYYTTANDTKNISSSSSLTRASTSRVDIQTLTDTISAISYTKGVKVWYGSGLNMYGPYTVIEYNNYGTKKMANNMWLFVFTGPNSMLVNGVQVGQSTTVLTLIGYNNNITINATTTPRVTSVYNITRTRTAIVSHTRSSTYYSGISSSSYETTGWE